MKKYGWNYLWNLEKLRFFSFLCQQVSYLTLNKSSLVRACCTASQWPRYQHYFDTICGFKGVQRCEMFLCWLCRKVGLSFSQRKSLFEHGQCQLLASSAVRLAAYPGPAPFWRASWHGLDCNQLVWVLSRLWLWCASWPQIKMVALVCP